MFKTKILIALMLLIIAAFLAFVPIHLEHKVLQLFLHDNNQNLSVAFCILASILILHSIKRISFVETIGAFFYAISATLILLSHNLITMLIMWEAAALSAILLLAGNNNSGPILRYTVMHFIGGTCILAAIFYDPSMLKESLMMSRQFLDIFSQSLLLIGILINCAAFPFSSWLTDTYPSTTPHATTILQIYVTKSAAFILFMTFSGCKILVPIGLATAIYALFYSIWQKRLISLLAYNSVGQMGLIITAIGYEANVIPYLFVSIIYQTILYVIASSLIDSTDKKELKNLGMLYKKMPIMTICSIIAVLTMSAFPFTASFNAKAIVTSAINSHTIKILFILINIGLLITCGMRFIYNIFFTNHKDTTFRVIHRYEILITLFITSFCFIPIFNIQSAYSAITVIKQTLLFLLSSIVFYSLRNYKVNKSIPEIDYLYRVLIVKFLSRIDLFIESYWQKTINALSCLLSVMLKQVNAIKIVVIPYTILFSALIIMILILTKLTL